MWMPKEDLELDRKQTRLAALREVRAIVSKRSTFIVALEEIDALIAKEDE